MLHLEDRHLDPFVGTSLPHRVYTGAKQTIGTDARQKKNRLLIIISLLREIMNNMKSKHILQPIDQFKIAAVFFGILRCEKLLAIKTTKLTQLQKEELSPISS